MNGPDSCCGVSQGVERGNGKSESIQFCRMLTILREMAHFPRF